MLLDLRSLEEAAAVVGSRTTKNTDAFMLGIRAGMSRRVVDLAYRTGRRRAVCIDGVRLESARRKRLVEPL